jgi:hypothetical protein
MWILPVCIDQHLLVIAPDRKEPRLAQKLETVKDAWPSVDQITYSDHAIHCAVEAKRLQSLVEINSLEVNVTYDEVTSALVLGQPDYLMTCSHMTSIRDLVH